MAKMVETRNAYRILVRESLGNIQLEDREGDVIIILNMVLVICESRVSSVGIALGTGWTIGVLGFDSRLGLGIFLFTTASRKALRSSQPPIQWVPGVLSLG
jgi:hypothetical protein